MAGEHIDIAATRITSRIVTNERALASLVHGAAAMLARSGIATPPTGHVLRMVTFVHDQIGDGYGRATEAGDEATRGFAAAGLSLDATYTAKSAAALLADPRTPLGETLFLNTLSAVEPIDAAARITRDDLPRHIAAFINDETNSPMEG